MNHLDLYLAGRAFDLGFAFQELVFCIHNRWLSRWSASDHSRPPTSLNKFVGPIKDSIERLCQAIDERSFHDLANQLKRRTVEVFQGLIEHWEPYDRTQLHDRAVEIDCHWPSRGWRGTDSPLSHSRWVDLRQLFSEFVTVMPQQLASACRAGELLAQVNDLADDTTKLELTLGEQYPIPAFEAAMVEVRTFYPQLTSLDTTLSGSISGDQKVPYSTYVQERISSIRKDLRRRCADIVEAASGQEEQNIFRWRFADWEIKFGTGRANLFKNLDGLHYLSVLIASPGKRFSATQLRAEKTRRSTIPDSQSSEIAKDDSDNPLRYPRDAGEIADNEAIANSDKEWTKLKNQLEDADELGNESEVARLLEEMEILKKYRKSARGPHGKKIKFSDQAKNDRDAVIKAIDLAMDRIKARDAAAYSHFRASLSRQDAFYYEPAPAVTWVQ